ncbi:MAG: TraR/DksA family transcriptional regulator [Betaproteobacteria bacterium]|nr:MAG: TraR/DksA family transcriptional regulator [Betaproteobacteria bacterium]RPI48616.1 MAG: TraR/DksA family transcriptional regulator [Betaproteobacteria bacterium]
MPLTDSERNQLKTLIDKRREELAAEIRSGYARSRSDSFGAIAGEAPDSGDEALASLVADTDNAETNRDVRELRELDGALERIGSGTYGACADCGDDIPVERLRAYPGAVRCVACQGVHEKTYSHPPEPKL